MLLDSFRALEQELNSDRWPLKIEFTVCGQISFKWSHFSLL
jgi:hypothetical protein